MPQPSTMRSFSRTSSSTSVLTSPPATPFYPASRDYSPVAPSSSSIRSVSSSMAAVSSSQGIQISSVSNGTSSPVSAPSRRKAITLDTMNQYLRRADYAVRGRLAIRADELREQLNNGDTSLPFKEIINANIGNPQAMDQKPITFFRQVLSLVQYPQLLDNEYADKIFFKDALDRARILLSEIGSLGAYSQSQGVPYIRKSIAKFIEERDGVPADPKDVYLANGASSAVSSLLTTICRGPETGVMIPVPQYPLYSATLTIANATPIPYLLEESTGWGTDTKYIASVVKNSIAKGVDLKAMIVINPCNPTGSCLSRDEIKDIITLAAENTFLIIADEVYQSNIYEGEFHSFKKVLRELQRDVPGKYDNVELASLHSTSKGMVGECGQRGGYVELVGIDEQVLDELYKLVSISLCPAVSGQVLTELMVNPPKPGDESYPLYKEEVDAIYKALRERAFLLFNAFKEMEGVSCQEPMGAMYLFPTISIPPKAIKEAQRRNEEPDQFYCLELLEQTGVCVVPGSGFGQKEGTFHFRTTFLAPGEEYVRRIIAFHREFLKKYS
ncbi:pyridoxal phosphate-dependent transferase [Lipomyces kononenkoae]|uniref:Pyridoxal phosphate-dependent transferase n=1 Tax=Lipomyces kononenkoae TaxID=34357 RepID=A0ACC3T622_LIPKO